MAISIRECSTVSELNGCVELQRSVFALPEVELSPVRHFIVTLHAGGFTLGAFSGDRLIGFVLSVPAFLNGKRAFYSHMAAVDPEYQSLGIGARLKWAQRERALEEEVQFVKWTFQPVQARNAYFNLEKLGAVVTSYMPDFYGTDYATAPEYPANLGLESDRLFAEWHLESAKVRTLAAARAFSEKRVPVCMIETANDWVGLVEDDPESAKALQRRVRQEFTQAFSEGLVCEGFERDQSAPRFLIYDAP